MKNNLRLVMFYDCEEEFAYAIVNDNQNSHQPIPFYLLYEPGFDGDMCGCHKKTMDTGDYLFFYDNKGINFYSKIEYMNKRTYVSEKTKLESAQIIQATIPHRFFNLMTGDWATRCFPIQ